MAQLTIKKLEGTVPYRGRAIKPRQSYNVKPRQKEYDSMVEAVQAFELL